MIANLPHRVPRWARAAMALTLAAGAAAALVATTGTGARAAAHRPGWRITAVFRGGRQEFDPGVSLQALAAVSSKDAWIAGRLNQSLTVREWNGKRWRSIAVPPGFTFGPSTRTSVSDSVVAASSSRDMWTFPQVVSTKKGPVPQYGLHWNGTSWTKSGFPANVRLTSAADFGPADSWVFGGRQNTNGFAAAYAARYNGSIWKAARAPGLVWLLSAPGPGDMWGLGWDNASIRQTAKRWVVMHWTGAAWHTVRLPALPSLGSKDASWQPSDIVGLGPHNVWVSEVPVVAPISGFVPSVSTALLHWNGSAWTIAEAPAPGENSGVLSYDGDGGFWLTVGQGDLGTAPADLLHYRHGRWTRQLAPAGHGYTDYAVTVLTYIPGTRSLWGVADVLPKAGWPTENAILKYGP
jgi:hypothetical protein